MRGLSLDQAPPLATVASFFVMGPLFAGAAGTLLAWRGLDALTQPFAPLTLALTHLLTLGFLGSVMMGALYQMIPVVLGEPVPRARLAHVVHASFGVGVVCLVVGITTPIPNAVLAAIGLLGGALLLFLAPVGLALWRTTTKTETASGMRFAVFSFFLVAALGLWMAHGHAGMAFPGERVRFVDAHLALGFFGWVASLLTAVSWQVVPMFYLAEEQPRPWRRATHVLLVVGALTPTLGLLGLRLLASHVDSAAFESACGALIRYGTAPALVGAFLLHPLLTLRSLNRRKRKRRDASVRFWQAAMILAPVVAVAAVATGLTSDPRARFVYGALALWGWAGLVMHGMLGRIVPFLVWFHRFSALAGLQPIPSMKSLLPDSRVELGLRLHLTSLVVALAGILLANDLTLRIAGALVVLTAAVMLRNIVGVLRRRPVAQSPSMDGGAAMA